MASAKIVGILNVTPDSFSDGGKYFDPSVAAKKAAELTKAGASYVELGADSTRPGSKCVGPVEEWRRLEEVIAKLPPGLPFAVDTHHRQVAEKAIQSGAMVINDISAGADPEMFSLIAQSKVKFVLMGSTLNAPHDFSLEPSPDLLEFLFRFFEARLASARNQGLSDAQIILDPGLGAFISPRAEDSWKVIRNFARFESFGLPLMVACSRKGFLKTTEENRIEDRDSVSALVGCFVIDKLKGSENYLRVHNVALQKEFLNSIGI